MNKDGMMKEKEVKYVAVINADYYNAEDNYSDGDIENDILDLVQNIDWKEKLYKQNMGYTTLYHLSHIRENILNWYPFTKQDSILEIGSGCGAITGVLCRRAKNVVSVELSKRRAQINYERHKSYKNLKIIVGNLNMIRLDEKFDYIVLNGVLEYAMSFTEGDTPYETFLNHLKEYLKPSGSVIIAIENRLGLKYFSGASEDHTGNYFLGLNGYLGNNQVRTFSKKELQVLLEKCEFYNQKFYYPYPDYKFPYEIFTDKSIEKYRYGRKNGNLDEKKYHLFDEELVSRSLREEGVLSIFANSFLVVAEKDKKKTETEIEYVKISNDRKKQYQLATVIREVETEKGKKKKEVVKFALNESAKQHIENIYQNEQMKIEKRNDAKGWNNLKGKVLRQEGILKYDYLYEDSLDSLMESYILLQKPECIEKELETFFRIYFQDATVQCNYHTEDFTKVFGKEEWTKETECISPANIDLILNNIFMVQNSYIVIDCEWIFEFYVPCRFIIWRSINELYTTKGQKLECLLKRRKLMERFQISEEDEAIFRKWADYFTDSYLGCNQMKAYQQPEREISLDKIYNEEKKQRVLCNSLYLDFGNGFSEENKLYTEVPILEHHFTVKYNLEGKNGLKKLRWDPLEGEFCECTIEKIQGFDHIAAENAIYVEGKKSMFYTKDPIYHLQIPENFTGEIQIEGRIRLIEKDDMITDLLEQNENYRDGTVFLKEIFCKVEEMRKEMDKVIEGKSISINHLERKISILERKIQGKERKFSNYSKGKGKV